MTETLVSAGERRMLYKKWLNLAYEEMPENLTRSAFKHCGVCKDRFGRENHKIRIQQSPSYVPPSIESDKKEALTKKQQHKCAFADHNIIQLRGIFF